MYNIQLNANFENWKLFWLRRNHPRFKQIAQKVFERDQYICQFCNFSAPKINFDVVNLDNNYHNNKIANLVTSCPLCTQCFFLESIGTGSFGGGVLIYLPEMTQNQLNALCNEIFVTIQSKAPQATAAESILRDFKFRSVDVEKIFGDNMSDPAKFGTLVLTANLEANNLKKVLEPLRLLPVRTRFTAFTEAAANALVAEQTENNS